MTMQKTQGFKSSSSPRGFLAGLLKSSSSSSSSPSSKPHEPRTPRSSGGGKGDTSKLVDELQQNAFRKMKLSELKAATNNFDSSRCIGSGGFGDVFLGEVPVPNVSSGNGKATLKWAVKRARQSAVAPTPASRGGRRSSLGGAAGGTTAADEQGDFEREVQTMSQLSHRNLVRLLGYCTDRGEQIVVYEFAEKGSLGDALHRREWKGLEGSGGGDSVFSGSESSGCPSVTTSSAGSSGGNSSASAGSLDGGEGPLNGGEEPAKQPWSTRSFGFSRKLSAPVGAPETDSVAGNGAMPEAGVRPLTIVIPGSSSSSGSSGGGGGCVLETEFHSRVDSQGGAVTGPQTPGMPTSGQAAAAAAAPSALDSASLPESRLFKPFSCAVAPYMHGRLTFRQRLDIALGTAEALHYLHTGAPTPLVHRDIKPDNILLNSNLKPKLADFGLVKLLEQRQQQQQQLGRDLVAESTRVMGTRGYLDPDYWEQGKVSPSADVYSFGVVLLETVTGRFPIVSHPVDIGVWREAKAVLEARQRPGRGRSANLSEDAKIHVKEWVTTILVASGGVVTAVLDPTMDVSLGQLRNKDQPLNQEEQSNQAVGRAWSYSDDVVSDGESGGIDEEKDPVVDEEKVMEDAIREYLQVALRCVSAAHKRPAMAEVVVTLKGIKDRIHKARAHLGLSTSRRW